MRGLIRALTAVLLLVSSLGAFAQFPDKPVHIIVPYGAGGPTDLTARLLATGLSAIWGKPVLVENRPGANGHLGTEAVVKSPADGYMLVVVPGGPVVINQFLFKKMPFNPEQDLKPITELAAGPLIMYVSPQLPVKTMAEFVRYAKANPGRLNFSSTGIGTLPHLAAEMLMSQAGIEMVHVPYKGVPRARAALMNGDAAVMFDTANALPQAKAGKIRALAIVGKKRYAGAPELPTAPEEGFPGMVIEAWTGLLAPANTPDSIVRKIQADSARALLDPKTKLTIERAGFEPIASTPEEFAAYMAGLRRQWSAVIKKAGIVPE